MVGTGTVGRFSPLRSPKEPDWRVWNSARTNRFVANISRHIKGILWILWLQQNPSCGVLVRVSSVQSVSLRPATFSQRVPGEMKKVLHSFLSRVTSRISFVMLTSLPATGGTRRKSSTLQDRDTYWGWCAAWRLQRSSSNGWAPRGWNATEGASEGRHESKVQRDRNRPNAPALKTKGGKWWWRTGPAAAGVTQSSQREGSRLDCSNLYKNASFLKIHSTRRTFYSHFGYLRLIYYWRPLRIDPLRMHRKAEHDPPRS